MGMKQKYHGDVTVIPQNMTLMEQIGLSCVVNPTVAHMRAYLLGGKKALFPHAQRINLFTMWERFIRNTVKEITCESVSESALPMHAMVVNPKLAQTRARASSSDVASDLPNPKRSC